MDNLYNLGGKCEKCGELRGDHRFDGSCPEMGKLVPIHDGFENPKAFLHHVAQDDNILAICMMTFGQDGRATFSHLNCSGSDIAFAASVFQKNAT